MVKWNRSPLLGKQFPSSSIDIFVCFLLIFSLQAVTHFLFIQSKKVENDCFSRLLFPSFVKSNWFNPMQFWWRQRFKGIFLLWTSFLMKIFHWSWNPFEVLKSIEMKSIEPSAKLTFFSNKEKKTFAYLDHDRGTYKSWWCASRQCLHVQCIYTKTFLIDSEFLLKMAYLLPCREPFKDHRTRLHMAYIQKINSFFFAVIVGFVFLFSLKIFQTI